MNNNGSSDYCVKNNLMNNTLFLLLLVCLFATVCYATTCGSTTCGANDQCCNDVRLGHLCYNPTTHRCTEVIGMSSNTMLCGIDESSCNDAHNGPACYNTVQSRCNFINGLPFDEPNYLLCDDLDLACTRTPSGKVSDASCYYPGFHTCMRPDGDFANFRRGLCGRGKGLCGETCYEPSEYNCCSEKICGKGEPGCDCNVE